jgi:hypothetical protein
MRDLLRRWLGRRAQPAPLDAGHLFAGQSEEQIKSALGAAIRGAFDEGVQAERKRISEILLLPDATRFPHLAVDLAVGGATAVQVAACLSRAEISVQARLPPTESPLAASTERILH